MDEQLMHKKQKLAISKILANKFLKNIQLYLNLNERRPRFCLTLRFEGAELDYYYWKT